MARRRSSSQTPVAVEAAVGHAVGRLSRLIAREMSGPGVDSDLSVHHVVALRRLRAHPGLSSAELARMAVVSPQAMSLVVLDLERRGLITRTQDAVRKRVLRAEITEAGREAVTIWDERIASVESQLVLGFGARDASQLRDLLERAIANLDSK